MEKIIPHLWFDKEAREAAEFYVAAFGGDSRIEQVHEIHDTPSGTVETVIWTLWFTYGAFYFCRTNISSAAPGLKASAATGGLGLSSEEVGWILASLHDPHTDHVLLGADASQGFGVHFDLLPNATIGFGNPVVFKSIGC